MQGDGQIPGLLHHGLRFVDRFIGRIAFRRTRQIGDGLRKNDPGLRPAVNVNGLKAIIRQKQSMRIRIPENGKGW